MRWDNDCDVGRFADEGLASVKAGGRPEGVAAAGQGVMGLPIVDMPLIEGERTAEAVVGGGDTAFGGKGTPLLPVE